MIVSMMMTVVDIYMPKYLYACGWVCAIAADDEYRLLWEVHISASGRRHHVIVSHLPGSDMECPACA